MRTKKCSWKKFGCQRSAVSDHRPAFTLIELLVVIVIILTLGAFAVAALASALSKAQMNGTMNNARQLYLAQFQMANDGAATGAATLAWPGDYSPLSPNLQSYINKLVGSSYLKGGDVAKLLSAPSCNLTVTVISGPSESVTFAPGTKSALKVHPARETDPVNTVFATTRNYVYDTAINASDVPYGTNGFVVMHKGGDAAVFKSGQATLAGWGGVGHEIQFQNAIGAKTGEAVGTVTAGDPDPGTLIY